MFWKKEGRCVALMCLAAFLQGMVFYGPVASLYRTQAGLSMGDIALIESVYYLLVVALELPLGAAAARLGYKRMLAVCSAVFFLSKLVFWRAGSFGAFLAERVMLAFVGAGLSGCDTAYLYVAAGPKRAQRALGLYGAAGMAGLLAATAAFTLFSSAGYRQAALATAVAYGLAALCTLALPAVPMQAEDRAAFSAQIRGALCPDAGRGCPGGCDGPDGHSVFKPACLCALRPFGRTAWRGSSGHDAGGACAGRLL